MTSHHAPEDVARWLDEATRGLPVAVKAAIRSELEAHYSDALEDHQSRGEDATQAHRAALADLGDARATASGLRETHLAHRWYIAAFVLSLLFPAILWLAFTVGDSISPRAVGKPIEDFIVLAPTFFIVYTFKKLVSQRIFTRSFDLAVWMLIGGLIAGDGLFDTSKLLFYPTLNIMPWEMTDGPALWFLAVALCGELAAGVGLLMLAETLLRQDDTLHGLRVPVGGALLVCGLSIVAFVAGVTFGFYDFAIWSNMLTLLLHLVITATLALLFFRAIYRGSRQRMQSA